MVINKITALLNTLQDRADKDTVKLSLDEFDDLSRQVNLIGIYVRNLEGVVAELQHDADTTCKACREIGGKVHLARRRSDPGYKLVALDLPQKRAM